MLMPSPRTRWIVAFSIALTVVVVDQLAKLWAPHVSATTFSQVHNPGLLLGVAAVPAWFLVLAMLAVMGLFVLLIARPSVQLGISPAIPALIVGGFAAHIVDRARFGVVRDFIHTPWIVIDVADIAVVVGIALLFGALALRMRAMHAKSQRITVDVRTLRAIVVSDGIGSQDLAA
jgi:lipoprotein signal peptidase